MPDASLTAPALMPDASLTASALMSGFFAGLRICLTPLPPHLRRLLCCPAPLNTPRTCFDVWVFHCLCRESL